ncbi:MAG: DUF6472 family protein [Clostridiales bacterium]|nr:DUF6472 family protein [Clostridiales bacterium]
MQYNCEFCAYYEYDEDDDSYFCSASMDEDDYAHLMLESHRSCPYFRNGDEYLVVRHQM